MLQIVIDTWVLHEASEGNPCAIELLNSIYHKCHRITVDRNNKILTEYRSVPGQFIARWLTLISSRKIIKTKIRKRCKNILSCRRDMKFVYACLNCSDTRVIVSEEYHFVSHRDKLAKKGIKLLDMEEALGICSQQS